MGKEFMNFSQVSPTKARIEIDGTIGGWDLDEWKQKNTGSDIRKQLKQLSEMKVDEIEVLITSLGGVVDDAFQIHDALRAHPAKVTTIIQGFCASAATIIACAGDKRIISPNALYLIHKCSSRVSGNENALAEEIEAQRTVNETILKIYKRVLKKEEAELTSLFEANDGNGKWITAEEAVAFGFATDIQEFDDNESKPVTAMARFLNHARTVFPDMNIINHQNSTTMKKVLASFAMLAGLLALSADTEYDEKEGLTLTPDQLKKVNDSLQELENTKNEKSQAEKDLQEAKTSLETANDSIKKKDDLIASLTAERDNFKAKYEALPAETKKVDGKDNGSEIVDVTDNEMYSKLESMIS